MVPLGGATEKIPSDTTNPRTSQLVAQCLNHYATPSPLCQCHFVFKLPTLSFSSKRK